MSGLIFLKIIVVSFLWTVFCLMYYTYKGVQPSTKSFTIALWPWYILIFWFLFFWWG